MAGEKDLSRLLAQLQPALLPDSFVFCAIDAADQTQLTELAPIASYREDEGLSLVLTKQQADAANLGYDSVFRCITLRVHSSLDAVGLTAAVAGRLAANGISANVIAAYYHDHVYVPQEKAEQALELLEAL